MYICTTKIGFVAKMFNLIYSYVDINIFVFLCIVQKRTKEKSL